MPASATRAETTGSPGILRFSLLVLIGVVLAINAAYMAGRFMPNHDTRLMLGFFDYFYSNYLFAGELPRWMVYGVYGLDSSVSYVSFTSAPNFLAMFLGKMLGAQDSLSLFCVSVCFEQLLLLLGTYLLCRRLFRNRLTIFCVCLTIVGTVIWQSQISLNLRLFALLPLEYYFLLRLRDEEKGCFGWLAGVTAILGPMGSAAYFYPLWALMIGIFSVVLFCDRVRVLLAMLRPTASNIGAAVLFAVLAASFVGMLWKGLDNLAFVSPDREGTAGGVTLASFLTYGGNSLGEMWKAFFEPSANVSEATGSMGMTDYLGMIGIFCFPFAWRQFGRKDVRSFAIVLAAVFALSRGGVLASIAYFFPGMHLLRHIGYLMALMKLLILILAGFGLEQMILAVRQGTLIQNSTRAMLVLMALAVVFYFDLNTGGTTWASLFGPQPAATPESLPPTPGDLLYPLGRAGLLLAFLFAVWRVGLPGIPAVIKTSPIALWLLVACVVGDFVLFQFQTRDRLKLSAERIAFPVSALDSAPERSDRLTAFMLSKAQAWEKGRGAEYQIPLSAATHWDPLLPHFRYDWFPKNVLAAKNVIEPNTNEFRAIFGPKFRLVENAIRVSNDNEALGLLATQPGWESKVILTDPSGSAPTDGSGPPNVADGIDIAAFSADSVLVNFTNSFPGAAWLVYSDAYTPGWHATVNGKPEPIWEAYAAFKAVHVEPGANTVRFTYEPGIRSICLTLFSTAAGILVAIGLVALGLLGFKEAFGS